MEEQFHFVRLNFTAKRERMLNNLIKEFNEEHGSGKGVRIEINGALDFPGRVRKSVDDGEDNIKGQ